MKIKNLYAFIFVFLSFQLSQAKIIPALSDFLQNEVKNVTKAINESPSLNSEKQEEMFFQMFLIRIMAIGGWDVNFGKIQVMPEIELLWRRDFKKGWESYKP